MTQAFSVIGVQHGHCHDMVRQLTGAGAKLVSVCEPDGEKANRLITSYPDALAVSDLLEILDDPDVSVVVLAVLPRERASLAIEVLRAGKHVLVAKPAALSMKELADIEAAQFASNRLWTVFYSEHFLSEATRHAVSLCHEGRLGQLRHLIFSAPHQLKPETRPEWFFDKARAGGILADLLTHQTQQLLSITKAKTVRLTHSRIERKDLLQARQFEIAGEAHFVADEQGVSAYMRADWLSPDGLGTWGDGRLMIYGDLGYIEVRKTIDISTGQIGERLLCVDKDGIAVPRRSEDPFWFGKQFLLQCRQGAVDPQDQERAVEATRLALIAQARAEATSG